MSRTRYAVKNIAFGYLSNIVITILGFVLRTVFIYKLDRTLLGVNGLYTNILSVLSLADLGLGTAMNFSLYEPVANKEYKKIAAYMQVFKNAYRIIAIVVAVLGLALVPFLRYIIKDAGNISLEQLQFYYIIFLVNIVSSYLVTYKYSLANAEQKTYIQTNITTITKLITVILQIISLLVWSNFTIYLLTQMAVELGQKIFVNVYLNRKYPYLQESSDYEISKEEKSTIFRNVKALLLHKIGDVARFQTDNIIISAFISVALVGIVDNYNLVITSIAGFVNIIFNSVLASLGNLVATENKSKQYSIFKTYRFLGAWIYGFSAVGFWVLLTPLINLLWGKEFILEVGVVGLILVDYYFKGLRIVLTNYKTAAGIFAEDKYIALIQGAVNLVISVALVNKLGLVGVYVGTVISGLIANLFKPHLIYRKCFDVSVWEYYKDSIKYIASSVLILMISLVIRNRFIDVSTWGGFICMAAVITVLYNAAYLLLFHRNQSFNYLLGTVKRIVGFPKKGD